MLDRNLISILFLIPLFLIVSCDKEETVMESLEDTPASTIDTLTTEAGIQFVRTPEVNFENLPDWPYPYQYVEIDGLRQAYAEAGPSDGPVVLLLHGQPSWSYLYRKMIPRLADAGYRVIAMDHVGLGRSDKPIDIEYYTYLGHNERLEQFIQALGLKDINLFVQDWGSVIGLRVAGLNPDWFASIAVGNGVLPVLPGGVEVFPTVEDPDSLLDISSPFANIPDQQFPFFDGCELISEELDNSFFADWMEYAMKGSSFRASETLEALTWYDLPDAEEAAYDAPFPSREYMAGIRTFPSLINEVPGTTQEAWAGLTSFERPFVTIWASNDPGTQGTCEVQQNFIDNVPGAKGKPHARLNEASHFLQDDQGEEIARRLVEFYNENYTGGNFGTIEDTEEVVVCESDPNDDPRRYCEFLLAYQRDGKLEVDVWGTQGLNNCPSQCLNNIDLEAIRIENGALIINLNGPRIWLPMGSADFLEEGSAVFEGLEVRLLASIDLDPEDIPTEESGLGESYEENIVYRNTVYQYPAGSEVYELISPEGAIYTMQSVSLMTDPSLTVNDLPTLPSRLELPKGWTYLTRTLEQDLILIAEGEATVITDDLGNAYQKRTSKKEAGFEILQFGSSGELIVWQGLDITMEAFDALDLPSGWLKNQAREGGPDMSSFARSPNAAEEGEFTDSEHFGYVWRHNATVIDLEVELPEAEGLLSGRLIAKYHDVQFNAGKTVKVLKSPAGDHYILITRDLNRSQEVPTIPAAWEEFEVTLTEDLILQLPNPTLNIRTDNEDSYQGPVSAEQLGL